MDEYPSDDEADAGPNGYYDEVSHDGPIDGTPPRQPLFPFDDTLPASAAGYNPELGRYFKDDLSLLAFPQGETQVNPRWVNPPSSHFVAKEF